MCMLDSVLPLLQQQHNIISCVAAQKQQDLLEPDIVATITERLPLASHVHDSYLAEEHNLHEACLLIIIDISEHIQN